MSGTVVTTSLNRNKRPPEQKLPHETGGGCQNCSGGCSNCPIKGKAPMQEEIQRAVAAIGKKPVEQNCNPTLDKESKSILGIRVVAAAETIFRIPKTLQTQDAQIQASQKTEQVKDSRSFQFHQQITRSKSTSQGEGNSIVTEVQNEPEQHPVTQKEKLATEQDPLKIDFIISQNPAPRIISFKTTSKPEIEKRPEVIQITNEEESEIRKSEKTIQNKAEWRQNNQIRGKDSGYTVKMREICANEVNISSNDNAHRMILVQKREIEVLGEPEQIAFVAKKTKDTMIKEPPTLKPITEEETQLKNQKSEKKEKKIVQNTKIKKEKREEAQKTRQKLKKNEKTAKERLAAKEHEIKIVKKTKETRKIEREAKVLTNQITKLVANEKFIKLNFRETTKLEALIKKLLAKRAEMKSKKKISIFELLEIFKKIKKNKAKSKLAA